MVATVLAVVLPAADEAEAVAAEVMRCNTGRHLCGATRPAYIGCQLDETVVPPYKRRPAAGEPLTKQGKTQAGSTSNGI